MIFIICLKCHISPFLTPIVLHIILPIIEVLNSNHIYICVYIHIYFVWRRRREWTIRIIEHCCEVSRQHLKMASKYKYSIFSSFFWSTSTIFSRLFFISMSPTSYNASWWCRNDVLFYLILACMWCIKLIMQEK